jgi:uncharacterized protein (TIGR02996 family)
LPTAQDFHEAIIASPRDDTPRLAYADWLNEQGDAARAEFIRVQIAVARARPHDERREELQQRALALLQTNRTNWLGASARLFQDREGYRGYYEYLGYHQGTLFERGMLEGVRLTESLFTEHAAALFRAWPIRHVWLVLPPNGRVRAFPASPCLRRLSGLCVSGRLRVADLANLVASPHLANLRELVLGETRTGWRGVNALRRSGLGQLESLSLPENNISASGAARLARWSQLSTLTELNLSQNFINCQGVEALCACEHPGRLRRLHLYNCGVSDAGARAIAGAERLRSLEVLELGWNALGDAGVQRLALSPHLRNLTNLSLFHTACRAGGAKALANSPVAASLASLGLSGNDIHDEGIQALANSPCLGRIAHLDLAENGVTESGLKAFTEGSGLTSLRALTLDGNDLGDGAARLLALWPGLARLRFLSLGRTRIGDAGAKALASSPYTSSVGRLSLWGCNITEQGQAAFQAAGLSNVRFDFQDVPEDVAAL